MATKIIDSYWRIGEEYFIRTDTHYYTGRLIGVTDKELLIEFAAWKPDDKKFGNDLDKAKLPEFFLYPRGHKVIIGRAHILDAFILEDGIPGRQK
jgi:hypothetical protein